MKSTEPSNPFNPPELPISAAEPNSARQPTQNGNFGRKICLRLGLASLAICGSCVAWTVFGLMSAFRRVSTASSNIDPASLALEINQACMPLLLAIPAGAAAFVLLIVAQLTKRG